MQPLPTSHTFTSKLWRMLVSVWLSGPLWDCRIPTSKLSTVLNISSWSAGGGREIFQNYSLPPSFNYQFSSSKQTKIEYEREAAGEDYRTKEGERTGGLSLLVGDHFINKYVFSCQHFLTGSPQPGVSLIPGIILKISYHFCHRHPVTWQSHISNNHGKNLGWLR